MDAVKGLTDVKIRMREGRPELGLKVNKQKAAYYGLSVNEIALAVHGQMRGLRGTFYHTKGREVETIARIDEKYRKTFEDVRRLILTTKDGTNVLLGQVADFKYDLGPSEVWRKDKTRVIQVSANIGSISLGKAVKEIRKAVKDVKFPENYYYEFGGNYKELVESQRQFLPIVALMLVLVYMVLASLYESYTQPFIIMISVPLAMIGITFSLWITHTTVSMGVVVGIIMLGGIVVNNAIILVDRVNGLKQKGMNSVKAIVLSGQSRLRPILMTTTTTILGLLPMAIERSESAGLWSPLAITVIGGLTSSTILTLFIIPCIYIAWEDAKIQSFQDLISLIKRYAQIISRKLFKRASVNEA
jgi:HAE1 family hydrophobic/amphiphilic exporter-1